jgi:hypothetical protein
MASGRAVAFGGFTGKPQSDRLLAVSASSG